MNVSTLQRFHHPKCLIAREVVRSGLRLLEDREQKMAALRSAIEKGLNSGIEEDFDSQDFLLQMKERKHGNI